MTEAKKFPGNIFLTKEKAVLCDWLCKLVLETRRTNGEDYTPCTCSIYMYIILSGLHRLGSMRNNKNDVNIFQDIEFRSLKNCYNALLIKRLLHAKGIGIN